MYFMSNKIELSYLQALYDILHNGDDKDDRTGTGTRQMFGLRLEHDMRDGFPLFTTKKMFWKGIIVELLWMLSGNTNIDFLQKNGVKIWNEWADDNGELGPVYGHQWRGFNCASVSADDSGYKCTTPDVHNGLEHLDQLQRAQKLILHNPNSRRILVSAWNPAQMDEMRLPPCHLLFQFNVSSNGYLDLEMYQRSADMFLGVPFDIASYAALLQMMAKVTGKTPRKLGYTFADAHIYKNHFAAVEEQLKRANGLNGQLLRDLPQLVLPESTPELISDYAKVDPKLFKIIGYESDGPIKAPIAV